MGFLQGYKTYISAAGLLGLGIFQITQGNIPGGIQSLLGAAAAASVRHAISTGGVAGPQGVPGPQGPAGMTGKATY